MLCRGKAKFKNEKYIDSNGLCDINKITEKNSFIKINVLNNGEVVTELNNFLTGEITLEAVSNNLDIDCNLNKCIWSSTSGLDAQTKTVKIETLNRVINGTYTFQITKDDEEEVKRYKSSINLKVDNEDPKIILDKTKDSVQDGKIKIIASDGIGSGIKEYYLGTSNDCSDVSWQESNVFDYNAENSYLVCVKDNVGNISREILENETSNNSENEVLSN